MPEERTFTEAEHQALLESAVEREVSQATETASETIASLEQQIDVLEAEKAAAEQAKDELQSEFEAFKQSIEEAAEVEARKTDRVERVKAAAAHLHDDYFTDQRVQRWAEMADEQFAALVEDFEEAAVAGLSKEEAKELEGLEGKDRSDKLAELHARKAEKASAAGAGRETAAFGGGKTPTAETVSGKSTFGAFLAASRGEKVAAE